MNNKKYRLILLIQFIIILLSGIFSSDTWYAIGVSIIGVVFKFIARLSLSQSS